MATKTTRMKTGFCSAGQHEGQRPRSPSGKPLKVCTYWQTCPCDCHAELTEMCEMADVERTARDNPDYIPTVSRFWMPDAEFLASLRASGETDRLPNPADVERGLDAPLRPEQRRFNPTPSGIRARGQLEDDVKIVCDRFDTGAGPISLPLSFIATQIHPDAPPSVGAIREVMLRWMKYGFATIGVEPLAFTGYTQEGRESGVEVMRYKWEQAKRLNKSKADRGYR